jgi:hypothetical protein
VIPSEKERCRANNREAAIGSAFVSLSHSYSSASTKTRNLFPHIRDADPATDAAGELRGVSESGRNAKVRRAVSGENQSRPRKRKDRRAGEDGPSTEEGEREKGRKRGRKKRTGPPSNRLLLLLLQLPRPLHPLFRQLLVLLSLACQVCELVVRFFSKSAQLGAGGREL